jgi:hypothetical protein
MRPTFGFDIRRRLPSATGEYNGMRYNPRNRTATLQYRICYVWTSEGPARVEIVDYH